MLTDHDTIPRSTGDRPADEIEITPEMIKAGVRALAECHSDFFDPEDVVAVLYREMRRLHSRS